METLKIAVGVITKDRAEMLRTLLASYKAMARPAQSSVTFIIVENDSTPNVQTVVDAFAAGVAEPVLYATEPEPGIPFARNRVLDMALEQGADILTFVDDDERVAADWLVLLTAGLMGRELDLVGGPLKIEAAEPTVNRGQEAVLAYLQERAEKNRRNRTAITAQGADHALDAYTNNWALRLDFARQTGLRFDTGLRFTGGSDTAFSKAVRGAGGRNGYVPDAIVHDRIPLHRLTLRYFYRRTRDQARNGVQIHQKSVLKVMSLVLPRLLEALVLALSSPITGRRSLVKAVYKVGLTDGRIRGVLGLKSKLYAPADQTDHSTP
ncbi:glycosyltransferase family 2 protein [Cognatishimia sp. MH4019]|uniref:glycosyltransferase n=1 Tax=Cognatishimia sp. MH4019 TaxID=2854030 RepID=UPI001CD29EB2|nr:glycosyltransferase family 2 protein [Cognatishimia sp. MH4019]